MSAGTRLRVDPIACDGRRLCAEILPELITLDDWGFPIIRDVDMPDHLLDEAREAVRLCPKLALRLESLVKEASRPQRAAAPGRRSPWSASTAAAPGANTVSAS